MEERRWESGSEWGKSADGGVVLIAREVTAQFSLTVSYRSHHRGSSCAHRESALIGAFP